MTKAVRKINKFDFSGEGAHVALVDKAANGQSVLIMKSATASEEEIAKALSRDVTVKMTIWEFLTRYLRIDWDAAEVVAGLLGYSAADIDAPYSDEPMTWVERIQERIDSVQINKSAETNEQYEKFIESFNSFVEKNLTSSVESEGGDVVTKAEDVKPTTEEVEMTQEEIQEMINKAAEDLATAQVEAVRKEFEAKEAATAQELQVLKAAHEARTHQEYLVKAAVYAPFLGENADKEAIAKALRAVESVEEAAPLLDVLKALSDVAGKDEMLEEVGKSATEDQPSDLDSQVIAVAKSLREADASLTQRQAEMKAYEQLAAQS